MIWKRRLEQMWTMVSDDSKMNTEPSAEWKHKNNSLTEQIRLNKLHKYLSGILQILLIKKWRIVPNIGRWEQNFQDFVAYSWKIKVQPIRSIIHWIPH